jgi:hypothetical protein
MSWLDNFFPSLAFISIGGTQLPQRGTLNFVSGASGSDNPSADSTDVTISATVNTTNVLAALASATTPVVVNGQPLESVAPAVNDTDATNKLDLDSIGWHSAVTVYASSLPAYTYANGGSAGIGATVTINATGTLTIDGHLLALSESVLINDGTTAAGKYKCTTAGAVGVAAVLTRATSSDEPQKLRGSTYSILKGTVAAGRAYLLSGLDTVDITIGTTALSWSLIAGGGGASLTFVTQTGSLTLTSNTTNEWGTVASAFTATLPAAPANGDVIEIVAPLNATAFPLTIAHNGNNIDGAAADVVLFFPNQSRKLEFSTANGWRTIAAYNPPASGLPLVIKTITLPTSGASPLDTTVFTVPASPTGAGRFVLTRCQAYATTLSGGGSCALTAGSSAGAIDILLSKTLNSGSSGIVAGFLASDLGSGMVANAFYEGQLSASGIVSVRLSTSGTLTGSVTIYIDGYYRP